MSKQGLGRSFTTAVLSIVVAGVLAGPAGADTATQRAANANARRDASASQTQARPSVHRRGVVAQVPSASITYLGADPATGWATFEFSVSFSECTDYGYCGWFAKAIAGPAGVPCNSNSTNFIWVGNFHDTPGSEVGTDSWPGTGDFDPVDVCVVVTHATQDYVVAEQVFSLGSAVSPPAIVPVATAAPECSDGIDNDGDGTIDEQDWGCNSPADNSEHLTRTPSLSIPLAKSNIRQAMKKRFKGTFSNGYAKRISGCAHRSRIRVSCQRVSWVIGDLSFMGRVTVWNSIHGEVVYWNASWRIRRTNEYCLATGGRHCVRTYRTVGG